jgi:hypothetical protein
MNALFAPARLGKGGITQLQVEADPSVREIQGEGFRDYSQELRDDPFQRL